MAAAKKPATKKETEVEVKASMTESKKVIIDDTVKYRKDFNSWQEYYDYKGKKA